jgi:hypothetical protein
MLAPAPECRAARDPKRSLAAFLFLQLGGTVIPAFFVSPHMSTYAIETDDGSGAVERNVVELADLQAARVEAARVLDHDRA